MCLFRCDGGEPIEFSPPIPAHALERFRGENYGNFAVVALDAHRFALRLVEDGGEVLLGVSRGDLGHQPSLTQFVQFVYFVQNDHFVAI